MQLFALQIATKSWSERYSTLTSQFQLPTLSSHRSYHKLLCTYKFLNGYSFCPSGLFTFHHDPNPRLYHSKYLVQPFAKTVSFFNSYFVSSVRLWNSLPNEVVLCNDVSSFKSNVNSIYLSWSFYLLLILLSQLFLFEVLPISFAIGPCNVLTYNHFSI